MTGEADTACGREADSARGREALALTRQWCAIPSVRGDARGLAAMAAALADWMRLALGAEVREIGPAAAPPVLLARIDAGRPATVILYNMYDVMPADPEGWIVDPFVGGVTRLDGIGPCFVGRGAENNKGPLAAMLTAVRRLVDSGTLPVNLEIVLDGQEESGSAGLRAALAAADCPLRRADSALFPSFCEYGGGPPRMYLGFSGIAKGTIRVDGGDWGGPTRPIHSSNAPWIANPAARLVQALAHLAELPTGRVGGVALDAEARALIDALAGTFDPAAELRFRHTGRYATDGTAAALLATVLSTASLNIASLHTDPEAGDAVIPCGARAGFDLRTPPGLDPSAVLDSLRRRLDAAGLDGVVVDAAETCPGARFAASAPGVAALRSVYAEAGRPAQLWPWAIGTAPAHAFAPYAPAFLIGGLGRGGNAHGINEFMTLDALPRLVRSVTAWLTAVGGSGRPAAPRAPTPSQAKEETG